MDQRGSVFGSSYWNETDLVRVPVENSGGGGGGRGGEGGEVPRRWRWRQAACGSWVQENDEQPNQTKHRCLEIGGGGQVAVRVRGEGVGEGGEGGGEGGVGGRDNGGEGGESEVWEGVDTEGEGVGEVQFHESEQRRKVTFPRRDSTETLDQRLSREFGFFPEAPLIRSEVPSFMENWPEAKSYPEVCNRINIILKTFKELSVHEQKEDLRLKDISPLLCTRENLLMQLRSLLRQLGDMDGAELEGVKMKEVHSLMTSAEHSSKVMSEELQMARIRYQGKGQGL